MEEAYVLGALTLGSILCGVLMVRNDLVLKHHLHWLSATNKYRTGMIKKDFAMYKKMDEVISQAAMVNLIGSQSLGILRFHCWTFQSFFKKKDLPLVNEILKGVE